MNGIKLDKRLIFVNVENSDKDQVLKTMSKRLWECGYVKETFYQALQDRERKYPTGIQGQYLSFAMPHTYPEHVLKSGICVAVCKHTIPFGSMEDRDSLLPCSIIFMLAITDPKQHLSLLKRLMEVTQNQELVRRLKSAETPEDIETVFE